MKIQHSIANFLVSTACVLLFLQIFSHVFANAIPEVSVNSRRSRFATISKEATLVGRHPKNLETALVARADKNPPITTVDEAKQHLSDPGSGNFLFYTGKVELGAKDYAHANGVQTIWDADKDGWVAGSQGPMVEVDQLDGNDPDYGNSVGAWDESDYKQFWVNFSEAFAQMARGTVYLALPEDGLIPANSILNQELVLLKASIAAGTIDRIMAFRLRDDDEKNEVGYPTPLGPAYQYLPCPNESSEGSNDGQ